MKRNVHSPDRASAGRKGSSGLLYTIGIAFACGIFIRSLITVGLTEIIFCLVVSLGLALLWLKRSGVYRSPMFLASLALLCLSLGALRVEYSEIEGSSLSALTGEEVTFEGVVAKEPEIRESNQHLYVRLGEHHELILVTTDRFQTFSYGDRVAIEGVLKVPEAFETDLGRTFNYPGYLKAKGAAYVISFADVTFVSAGEGNAFLSSLLRAKARFMHTVESILPEPQAGLSEGLLLGVKRALGEDLEEIFRSTGIIHIVVLSGYNVMLVAEGIMRLLSFIFSPRVRMAIGVVGISMFALLVGLTATVVRASVMAILVLIARATGRTYAILRALLLAGVVMLLINPYLLVFDPGFQLSFLATLGLIVLAPFIEKKLHLVPTTFQMREFLTATVTTQLFVLPLLLYQIGEFSLVSVIVNVLVLPMVPVAMLATFAAGIAGMIMAPLGVLTGYVAHLSLSYIIYIAEFFGGLPFAAVSVPVFPFWVVAIVYAVMAYALLFLYKKEQETVLPVLATGNSLSGWTIEEEMDGAAEAQGASAAPSDPLPFR